MKREIAALNDAFRLTLGFRSEVHGRTVMTRGVASLPGDTVAQILRGVATFNTFTSDNDPYGEHDMGRVRCAGVEDVFFKFDYFENADCEYGAENGLQCYRVLTIMLAREY